MRVEGLRFRVQGRKPVDKNDGLQLLVASCVGQVGVYGRVLGFRSRVSGFGSRVSGFGFRV